MCWDICISFISIKAFSVYKCCCFFSHKTGILLKLLNLCRLLSGDGNLTQQHCYLFDRRECVSQSNSSIVKGDPFIWNLSLCLWVYTYWQRFFSLIVFKSYFECDHAQWQMKIITIGSFSFACIPHTFWSSIGFSFENWFNTINENEKEAFNWNWTTKIIRKCIDFIIWGSLFLTMTIFIFENVLFVIRKPSEVIAIEIS